MWKLRNKWKWKSAALNPKPILKSKKETFNSFLLISSNMKRIKWKSRDILKEWRIKRKKMSIKKFLLLIKSQLILLKPKNKKKLLLIRSKKCLSTKDFTIFIKRKCKDKCKNWCNRLLNKHKDPIYSNQLEMDRWKKLSLKLIFNLLVQEKEKMAKPLIRFYMMMREGEMKQYS